MSTPGTGDTTRDGQLVPEPEVDRLGPETMSFEARAAETVKLGRGRTSPLEAGQTFAPQTAETVTLRPPHWENLVEVLPEAAAPMETECQALADGPSEPQPEPPAPQARCGR